MGSDFLLAQAIWEISTATQQPRKVHLLATNFGFCSPINDAVVMISHGIYDSKHVGGNRIAL